MKDKYLCSLSLAKIYIIRYQIARKCCPCKALLFLVLPISNRILYICRFVLQLGYGKYLITKDFKIKKDV